jgi:hypothetical protein
LLTTFTSLFWAAPPAAAGGRDQLGPLDALGEPGGGSVGGHALAASAAAASAAAASAAKPGSRSSVGPDASLVSVALPATERRAGRTEWLPSSAEPATGRQVQAGFSYRRGSSSRFSTARASQRVLRGVWAV